MWMLVGTQTINPGDSGLFGGKTQTADQSFVVEFPQLPEGLVRLYGDLWWRRRNTAPANAIVAQQAHWRIWHNGTQVTLRGLATGGGLVMLVSDSFPSPLQVRLWRFDG